MESFHHPRFETKATRVIPKNPLPSVEDIEVIDLKENLKRSSIKGPSYSSTSSSSLNTKQEKFKKFILILGWGFVGLLILRLVFAERGIIDFVSRQNLIKEKKAHFKKLRNENDAIKKEINLIQNDPQYQKKMSREYLGHIAKDEFMVLFSEEKDSR